MDIDTFKNFEKKELKSIDFERNYENFLHDFLDLDIEHSETIFLDKNILDFSKVRSEIIEVLNVIIGSEDIEKKEYINFFRNRGWLENITFDNQLICSEDDTLSDALLNEQQHLKEIAEIQSLKCQLNKRLSINQRILQFLESRSAEVARLSSQVPKLKAVNSSKEYSFRYFEDINNGLVTKFDMINFLEPHNTIEKLNALIEAIEDFKVDFISYSVVYNDNKQFNETRFEIFKEIVSNKIEQLQKAPELNKTQDQKREGENEEYTKSSWFIVGLNIANGKIQEMIDEKRTRKEIANIIGLKKTKEGEQGKAPYIGKSIGMEPCGPKASVDSRRCNVFNNPERISIIYYYCLNNNITMTSKFKKKAEEIMRLL